MESSAQVSAASPSEMAPSAAPEALAENSLQEATPPQENQKEDLAFSQKFSALTRKEKLARQKIAELKAIQNDPTYKEFLEYREVKKDPRRNAIKIVESLGVPLQDFYKDLTGLVLNDGKPDVELEVRALREQFEADRERRVKEAKDSTAKAEAAAVENYKRQAASIVESSGEAYELIAANAEQGAIDLVLEVAEQYWHQNKKILHPKQACDVVENFLTDKAKGMLRLKKLQAKESLAHQEIREAPEKKVPEAQEATHQHKTLTNRDSAFASQAAVLSSTQAPLDPEKRKAWTAEKLRRAWNSGEMHKK